jgi:hypothetical protein
VTNAGVQSNVNFDNSLPQGAFILRVLVEIVTTFNGGASLTVGTVAAGYNNIVAAADVNEGVAGVYDVTRALGRGLTAAAEKTPVVAITQNAATQGQAIIVIDTRAVSPRNAVRLADTKD